MVLVAASALAMVFLLAMGRSLLWLWRTPGSVNMFYGGVIEHQVLGTRSRSGGGGAPLPPRFRVGAPAAVVCIYEAGMDPPVPPLLPYIVTVHARLIDPKPTPWVVMESQSRSTWVVNGVKGWDQARGVFATELTPPRSGDFAVQYEVTSTHLVGRTARVGLHTGGLKAE